MYVFHSDTVVFFDNFLLIAPVSFDKHGPFRRRILDAITMMTMVLHRNVIFYSVIFRNV